jgi:hypothetical protein
MWTRDLQIRIPDVHGIGGMVIVSLGMFKRRRFADLCVTDAGGRRMNLLTRYQHGMCLTNAALIQYLADEEHAAIASAYRVPERQRSADEILLVIRHQKVIEAAYAMFTDVDGTTGAPVLETVQAARVAPLGAALTDLFIALDSDNRAGELSDLNKLITEQFFDLQRVTQYLCWVDASGGETVNLRVQYSMADARTALYGDEHIEPGPGMFARRRMRAYRAFGLAPLNYRLAADAHDHTGSYYFTLEPPPATQVAFVDWGLDNSVEERVGGLEAAGHCVHVNNANAHNEARAVVSGDAETIPDKTIHAYLRSDPFEHKKLAAGALLNGVFVYLIANGRFDDPASSSAQTWLLLTPTLLTAYIAQQQRHYYARATRRQRFVLWLYLFISVTFLVSASFRFSASDAGIEHWGWFATASAWAVAIASAGVFALYVPAGNRFNEVTARGFRRSAARERIAHNRQAIESTYRLYDEQVLRRCDQIVGVAGGAMLAVALGLALFGWGPQSDRAGTRADTAATAVVRSCPIKLERIGELFSICDGGRPSAPNSAASTFP